MAEPNLAVEAAAGNTKVNRTKSKARKRNTSSRGGGKRGSPIAFPKHSISKCLRIPQAILEQNAGKECTDREAAKFAGVGWTGQIAVEISSALKFGLLERPAPRTVKPTDLTRRIIRPQKSNEKRDAMREAVLKAPVISDVYKLWVPEILAPSAVAGKCSCPSN